MNVTRVLLVGALLVCVPGIADAQTEWVEDPDVPVLEPPAAGSWDDGGRLVTAVIKVGGVYHMFFRGWGAADEWFPAQAQIGHATSSDGIAWESDPANPVLVPGTEGEWDDASLEGAAVIHDGSGFRMWYAAVTPVEPILPPLSDYTWHGVGYATSPDGSTWTKHPENPIVAPGMRLAFEGRPAVPQTVILENGLYRMWFTDPIVSVAGVGYAVSEDGLSWNIADWGTGTTLPSLPRSVYTHLSVVSTEGLYYMFLNDDAGYPWNYLAASQDGINWSMYTRGFKIGAGLTVLSDDGVFEAWYSGGGGPAIYRLTSDCCSTVFTWFLPAAAHGAGAGRSFFRTEVVVTNAGDRTAEYRLVWFPRGEGNRYRDWMRSDSFSIAPGTSARYDDVLAEVFGLGPGSFGALAVEASSDELLAMGRITAIPTGESAGTCGQSLPAIRIDDFIAGYERERRRILFGGDRAKERLNLVCVGTGGDIYFEFYDDTGALFKKRKMTLTSWENDQLNGVLDANDPDSGFVEMWSDSGDFYCFGSLLDNETSEAITIPPL